ncbi:hypothetical protein GPALN_006417 [Globodera pallida]|nr:hypothetical protein GPALN_006417 [Globodera pallida]
MLWPVPLLLLVEHISLLILLFAIFGCHSQFFPPSTSNQSPSLSPSSFPLMDLISSRNINDLTQLATQVAAQAMKSNGQMIANSGPEVKPIATDARPSEMLGQGLTNMLYPTRQLASRTLGATPERTAGEEEDIAKAPRHVAETAPEHRALFDLANTFLGTNSGGQQQQSRVAAAASEDNNASPAYANTNRLNGGGANDMIGQAMRMLSGSLDTAASTSANGGGQFPRRQQQQQQSSLLNENVLPSLRQLFPGAEKNFGIRQGEGCLPFLGEFMKMAYGNCVKRADEKTWDAWGKEINHALSGGKIDLLRASKETCKMGAEREQCGQLRKAISGCDILGSIQLASNIQRSVSRCDEITGLMDQNPGTILNQMNGLINGEVAQGLINNFLGG